MIATVLILGTWAGTQYLGIGHVGCRLGERWSGPHARREWKREFSKGEAS